MTPDEKDLFQRAANHATDVFPPAVAVCVWQQLFPVEPVSQWTIDNWLTRLANDVLSIPKPN